MRKHKCALVWNLRIISGTTMAMWPPYLSSFYGWGTKKLHCSDLNRMEEKHKTKLTVSSGEVGQRVVALLTVHYILQVQEKKSRDKPQKGRIKLIFLSSSSVTPPPPTPTSLPVINNRISGAGRPCKFSPHFH